MIEQLSILIEAAREKALENMHSKLTNGVGKPENLVKEAPLNESPENKAMREMHEKIENYSLESEGNQKEVSEKETGQKENEIQYSSLENMETINRNLEGIKRPETGVPFVEKTIETPDGLKINGVFPDFKEYKYFETKLPEYLQKETDPKQFKYCDEQLSKSVENGNIDFEKFSDRQLEQIKNGDKPKEFLWHHNEDIGKMELVATDIHLKTHHTGGKSIWGGGSKAR